MGIDERIDKVLEHDGFYKDGVKQLVVEVLEEMLESGHDIGGLGEYGKGWNDRGVQIKVIVEGIVGRWQNET